MNYTDMEYDPYENIVHYGMPRRSGRYPWGSGKDPYQRNKNLMSHVNELKGQGMTSKEIAKSMGMSIKQLRKQYSNARAEVKKSDIEFANRLHEKGVSNVSIAARLGVSEGTIRQYLKEPARIKNELLFGSANKLKEKVESDNYVDIGAGTEKLMGISRTKLDNAVQLLKDKEGYVSYDIYQTRSGSDTSVHTVALCKPGTTYGEVYKNRDKIAIITDKTDDGGKTFTKIEPPIRIDPDRVQIRYKEDGGMDKDGVIELRRGVDDISLGNADYAQVRIAVKGDRYLKGMALYADDLPSGIDIRFNTNKSKSVPKMDVLKSMKTDSEDNPFGATIKLDDELILAQRHYKDKDGNEKLSALNIVNEEGNWAKWAKTISSQFLAKQKPKVAKERLDADISSRQQELDEILSLTNPTVKKKLLKEFSDTCDTAASHQKAAAFPRQASHVILPFPDIPENQIYAPNYRSGERVVLVRHPHGGIFELPVLTVNNELSSPKKLLGSAPDAIGIHPKVAAQLSGADFDGDTVLVIPDNGKRIRTREPLEELKNFDPHAEYAGYPGMKIMGKKQTQIEMGKISNLITDMTVKGAPFEDIALAVKHSMVVIDARKHELDWKRSYTDNHIEELKKKYQSWTDPETEKEHRSASTILSRSDKKIEDVPDRREKAVSKMTKAELERYYNGEKIYEDTGKEKTKWSKDKEGNFVKTKVPRTQTSTYMKEAKDARELVSGNEAASEIENIYADYSNQCKALANRARSVMRRTSDIEYNPEAYSKYRDQVISLNDKLEVAQRNAPYERKAQMVASIMAKARIDDNPDLDSDDIKKIKSQCIRTARARLGAKKITVKIDDQEWEAIQAGAIKKTKLNTIFDNADMTIVKQMAMPRTKTSIPSAKLTQARRLLAAGASQSEVADILGVSTSTLMRAIDDAS